jgi:hypothetical protein
MNTAVILDVNTPFVPLMIINHRLSVACLQGVLLQASPSDIQGSEIPAWERSIPEEEVGTRDCDRPEVQLIAADSVVTHVARADGCTAPAAQ